MNINKQLLSLLLSLLSLSTFAQTTKKTLNYQAVILDPKAIDIPGATITGQPLNKGNVCLRFSLLNTQGGLDYEETQQVTTDEYGLVNVAIGTGTQASSNSTSIYKSFESIVWNSGVKSLKVSVSFDGCASFKQVSTQALNYTPYALYAEAVDYKNVREAPTKLSQFSNDAGYLIPKDLDPIKADIKSNTSQLATSNQTIADNKKTSDAAFLLVNQSLTSLDKQVTENTSSITTIETKLIDQQSQIFDNRNQITATNNTMNAQIGGLQGQINSTNSTVSNLTGGAEMQSNKSTATNLGGANPSDQAYPSQRAAKAYVDLLVSQIATSGVPDATTLAPGKLQLAGDLGGTATNPTVPALANKESISNKSTNVQTDAASDTKYPSVKAVKAYMDQATLGTALAADLANKANIASPAFTGTPTAPTPTSNDNSTKIATTAFVQAATSGIALQTSLDGKADKNSPTFTGTPVLPAETIGVTQSTGDNSTKLATTAFVTSSVSAGVQNATATALGKIQLAGDLGGSAASPTVPGLALKAPLASPTFTGTPVLPTGTTGVTQTAGDNSTKLATTAYVATAVSAVSGNSGVPYTGATGSVNLGSYDLTVNGLTVGRGGGNVDGNTANGNMSLYSNSSGNGNTAYGYASLYSNTSGSSNIANGNQSLYFNTTGSNNTAIGNASLNKNTAGGDNTANGFGALFNNITGSYNTANGSRSLYSNTTASENTANGSNSLYSNTTGQKNTATGFNSLYSNTSGGFNTANGNSSLSSNTTGDGNTAIGSRALTSNTTGDYNTATGFDAMSQNSTGQLNTAYGMYSVRMNTSGNNNTGVGYDAIYANTTGSNNTASGSNALSLNTTGNYNTADGYQAGRFITNGSTFNTTSDYSVYLGTNTKASADDAQNEVVIGYNAIGAGSNTVQLGNTSVTNVKTSGTFTAGDVTYPKTHGTTGQVLTTNGSGTLAWATASGGGSGVPYSGASQAVNLGTYDLTVNGLAIGSGKVGTSGSSSNTIVGGSGGNRTFTSAESNTAIGYNTLSSSAPGNNNTAVGAWSLVDNNNGLKNSAMGVGALQRNLGGNDNTAIGYYAMQNNLSGSRNTALGYEAGFSSDNTTINNATAIGYQAKVAASNTIQLGADGTNSTTAITNVKTSGTITAGAITYPNTAGTNGQVLTTNGSGTATWASASSSSGVPYSGASQAVNLGTYDLTVNGLTIGTGRGTTVNTFNTIVGGSSANRANQGTQNTAIGYNTISASTPGEKNTAIGAFSLVSNSGVENSAIGVGALERNLAGGKNTAVGYYALRSNTTGSNNTAIGNAADMTDGLSNATAIGSGATVAASNTIQLGNTDVTNVKTSGTITVGTVTYPNTHGTANQVLSTTGSGTLAWTTPSSGGVPYTGATGAVNLGAYDLTVRNLTIGTGSGNGSGNTALGYLSLNVNTANDNTAIGYRSLSSNTTGVENTANGNFSLANNTTGLRNTANGTGSLQFNISGSSNAAFGEWSLYDNTTGSNNTAIGSNAGNINITGSNNTFIGNSANVSSNNLSNATAIGYGATVASDNTIQLGNASVTTVNTSGNLITGGTLNGVRIGRGNGDNDESVAVGSGAMSSSNVNGKRNTAVGYAALNKYNGTNFDGNTGVGYYNLVNLTTGAGNTSVGAEAMMGVTTGTENTSIGVHSLMNANGNENVGVGQGAGSTLTTGSRNTIIGKSANVGTNNLSNTTAIGYGAIVSASNTIQLGADGTNGTTAITNVKTSGTITAGDVTYPNAHGSANQVLSTTGSGTLAWTTPSSGGVPYTGATQAVDLGAYNLKVNGLSIGVGNAAAQTSNTAIGNVALSSVTNGYNNTALGYEALKANTNGANNLAVGWGALTANIGGGSNVAIGVGALGQNTSGGGNVALGAAGAYNNGDYNTFIGTGAGNRSSLPGVASNGNIYIGKDVGANNSGSYNIIIGASVQGGNGTTQNFDNINNQIILATGEYGQQRVKYDGTNWLFKYDVLPDAPVYQAPLPNLGSATVAWPRIYGGTVYSNNNALSSDLRLKSNISPLANSLATILQLNPVHYLKKSNLKSTNFEMEENGFIAQEIQKVLPFIVKEGTDKDKILSVDYNSIIPLLTKGIQEQQNTIQEQQNQINDLNKKMDQVLELLKTKK
jgi:hypothetical protein